MMRRTVTKCGVLLLFLLLVQTSWAQFGGLIDKAKKIKKGADIYTPWTPEQESAIGQASAAKLINVFGVYENPAMVQYLNLVGDTVARQATRNVAYHFAILDTEAVTALGLPGGYIFVTRGLLANMTSESQLAGVLGHEIAHIDRRHLEKEVRSQKTAEFAKEEAAEKIPTAAELVNMAGQIVTTALTLQVSRDKETEADKVGLDLATKAGYAPAGLRDVLDKLAKASSEPNAQRALGLWGSTHPPFSERVTALNALLVSYPAGGQTLDDRYTENINPTAFTEGSSYSSATAGAAGAAGELDGIISKGVVVLMGAQLPEGTRVKVRVVQ